MNTIVISYDYHINITLNYKGHLVQYNCVKVNKRLIKFLSLILALEIIDLEETRKIYILYFIFI